MANAKVDATRMGERGLGSRQITNKATEQQQHESHIFLGERKLTKPMRTTNRRGAEPLGPLSYGLVSLVVIPFLFFIASPGYGHCCSLGLPFFQQPGDLPLRQS